jgi:drug/metabolite transporter (DMT)-like permease
MSVHRRNGVFAMVVGIASFVANDALLKFATQSMPGSQVVFVRGACAVALLLALGALLQMPLRWRAFSDSSVSVRTALEVGATVTFVVALKHLPLADATAIYMASPILTTLLAVFLLGEVVSVGRWLAIVVGFAGVLFVVQPGSNEFNVWSLLMLLSAVLNAYKDLVTRSVSREIPSLALTTAAVLGVLICSAAWGVAQNWQPISVTQFGVLASAGVLVSCGYFFVTVAIREGELGVVVPLRYVALLFATILGYIVWGDIPGPSSWCGMMLIVAAGIYLIRGK